jgi:hypothetical protein
MKTTRTSAQQTSFSGLSRTALLSVKTSKIRGPFGREYKVALSDVLLRPTSHSSIMLHYRSGGPGGMHTGACVTLRNLRRAAVQQNKTRFPKHDCNTMCRHTSCCLILSEDFSFP